MRFQRTVLPFSSMLTKKFILYMLLSTIAAAGLYLALQSPLPTTIIASPFEYLFNSSGTLYEAGSMSKSTSPYWWLNSGAKLVLDGGTGKTVHGSLPTDDKWRKLYASANPIDTDNGYHPQNIFRLVSKSEWQNFRQQAYLKISADQLSDSPNRNASNGLLLFNRYIDGDDLYYTGVRVDGTAVIKKKVGGTYYTLAQKKLFPGAYDRSANPNLLPKNKWIGIRADVTNTPDGKASIKFYTDVGKTGTWTLALSVLDDGSRGAIIDGSGAAGMRTDFMDVEFDDYKIERL